MNKRIAHYLKARAYSEAAKGHWLDFWIYIRSSELVRRAK